MAGGTGNDTLTLGAGDDTALFSGIATTLGLDQVDGGIGSDTVNFSGLTTAVLVDLAATALEAKTKNAAGAFIGLANTNSVENITGAAHADELLGDGLANVIKGGAGNDKITGRGGNDTLLGESGDDAFFFSTAFANGEYDKVDGGANIDTLDFTGLTQSISVNLDTRFGTGSVLVSGFSVSSVEVVGIENVIGTANNDSFNGSAAANVLRGGSGNDWMNGGGGADSLFGDAGNDVFFFNGGVVSSEFARIDGGTGTDTLSFVNFLSPAGVEVDLIHSGPTGFTARALRNSSYTPLANATSVENVEGSNWNDVLAGDTGANKLRGNNGRDLMTGRAGADTFQFERGDSGQTLTTKDTINDFAKGAVNVGDKIDYVDDMLIGGSNAAASASQASINATTGVASFAAGSGTTLADALFDITTRMTAATNTTGEFTFFKVGGAGPMQLFISDGVAGVTANDVLIQLNNITTVGSINLAFGDLTILA